MTYQVLLRSRAEQHNLFAAFQEVTELAYTSPYDPAWHGPFIDWWYTPELMLQDIERAATAMPKLKTVKFKEYLPMTDRDLLCTEHCRGTWVVERNGAAIKVKQV